jgi:hypothetical protein
LIAEMRPWRGIVSQVQGLRLSKGLPPIACPEELVSALSVRGSKGELKLSPHVSSACPLTSELLLIAVSAPVVSVEPERGFSAFKHILTRLRSKLNAVNLCNILFIYLHTQDFSKEEEDVLIKEALTLWRSSGTNRRCDSRNYMTNKDKGKVKIPNRKPPAGAISKDSTSFSKVAGVPVPQIFSPSSSSQPQGDALKAALTTAAAAGAKKAEADRRRREAALVRHRANAAEKQGDTPRDVSVAQDEQWVEGAQRLMESKEREGTVVMVEESRGTGPRVSMRKRKRVVTDEQLAEIQKKVLRQSKLTFSG